MAQGTNSPSTGSRNGGNKKGGKTKNGHAGEQGPLASRDAREPGKPGNPGEAVPGRAGLVASRHQ